MANTTPPYPDPIPGGGVWNGTGWIPKDNPAAQGIGTQTGTSTPTSNTLNWTPTAAPTFNAPKWQAPTGTAPTLNMPGQFQAPDPSAINTDPSYQFRLNQGLQALQNSRSAQGTLRGGATLKALTEFGQNAASQEYQNIYNRSRDVYDANAARAQAIYGAQRDAYSADATERQNAFNAGFRGAEAEYAPQNATWQATNLAGQRGAEMNWQRGWDREVYDRDAAFREADSARNDAYRWGAYRGDDSFRRDQMDLQNRQWLVEQGNR